MSEVIIIAVVIVLLLFPQFLIKRIKKPLSVYIKIVSAIAFLVLIWFFGDDGKWAVKVILSAVMLTVLYKEYLSIKKASF